MLTMYLLYGPKAWSVDIDRTGAPIDNTHGTQALPSICFTINTSTKRINDDITTSYRGLMTHFLLQVSRGKKERRRQRKGERHREWEKRRERAPPGVNRSFCCTWLMP